MLTKLVLTCSFIDKYILKANPTFIKVYLCVANFYLQEKKVSLKKVSDAINVTSDFVIIALEYWNREEIIKFTSTKGDNLNIEFLMLEENQQQNIYESPSYDVGEIFQQMDDDQNLRELVALAETSLPRQMTSKDITTFFYLYDVLKFPPMVILMLVEYCASLGKTRIDFIEKMGINWHQNDITTVQAVEKYLDDIDKREKFIKKVKELFGITDRELSKSEKTLVSVWFDKFHYGLDMVERAYNTCMETIQKASIQYANGILQRWSNANFKTPADVENARMEYRNSVSPYKSDGKKPAYNQNYAQKNRQAVFSGDLYDYDAIERLAAKKLEDRFRDK